MVGGCSSIFRTMAHWSENIQAALLEKKWSIADLIRESGVSRDLVYKYMRGEVESPRGDILTKLGAPLGMTEMEVRYGVRSLRGVKNIPLLKMNKLGTLEKGEDFKTVWDGASVVTVPGDVSDACFAVDLDDESGGDEFRLGDTIICDTAAAAAPGRYVIAAVPGLGTGVFRRYRPIDATDRRRFDLIAPNPNFPEIKSGIDAPAIVLGRAVKHVRDI